MADLPEKRIPMEGGWGSSLLGITLTGIAILMMGILIIYPQSGTESFMLTLISAGCLLGTGATVLTLVSDYALILSSTSLFLLLLFYRLRYLGSSWLLLLSVVTFCLAIIVHIRSPGRRFKGRPSRGDTPT